MPSVQFVSEWVTPDRRRLVVFAPAAVQVFMKHRQRFPWQTEAGGILLGKRRGNHLEVLFATEPMITDRRRPFFFEREVNGHATAAMEAWATSGGTVDYLGEWHTHPQRVPVPSSFDRTEWRKLLSGRAKHSPLVALIVGTTCLHVELLCEEAQIDLKPVGRD
ncbi:MAG: Mov34/MPN/PAD-1 family protein [Polaromonas sp.]|nr:Mov34/MPN/PAD-1 family protein [Polaromonas sp.]